jgi:uroporphyrinogen decarboxylase
MPTTIATTATLPTAPTPPDPAVRALATPRECYRRIALFQKAPYIPNYDSGPAPRTVARWHREGLPAGVDLGAFFGFDEQEIVRTISYDPIPGVANRNEPFPQTDEWNMGRNAWGRVGKWHRKHADDDEWAEAAFEVVRGGLQTRAEWEEIRDQFEPRIAERYGDNWDEAHWKWPNRVAAWRGHQHWLVLEGPSMIGQIKEHLGFENYCLKLMEDPGMIEEIMEKRTELALAILDRAVTEVEFDMLWFWEDIGYRNGPILSPEVFEKLAVPRYKRLSDWYRSRGGEIVSVDSDGDVRLLIPGWLRGGINHIWPLEPFAGMDVVALRREYGQAFSMRGGIDKFCIAGGKEAIDRELDRVCPVVQDGGFIPHLDHMVPDAPFENYCYYMEQKHLLLGTRPKPPVEVPGEAR